MATGAAVAVGTLGNAVGNTTDLTVSGFGTPTAALLFACSATPSDNPNTLFQTHGVGFWTSGGSRSVSFDDDGSQSTTRSARQFSTSPLVLVNAASTDANLLTWSAATITDGLRLTVSSGSSGTPSRYVWALLFKGTTGESVGTVNLGTGTSGISVTDPGFKPDLVVAIHAGMGSAAVLSNALLGFGVAHINSSDSITQACVSLGSNDNVSTSQTNAFASSSAIAAQAFTDTVDWTAAITAVGSSGFTITPSADANSDIVGWMALKLADADDAHVSLNSARTSTGSQAKTGVGFTPAAVLFSIAETTADGTASQGGALSFGGSDGTRTQTVGGRSRDAVTTTDCGSYASTSNPLFMRTGAGSINIEAALTSLDSDGWTLNYTTASGSAQRFLAIAIGDSTAGGGAPTLSDLQAVSITASSVQGTYDYAF